MSSDPTLINKVRAAASCAGDTSGNADAAAYYCGQANSQADVLRELEWAASNAREAVRKIDDALVCLREGGAA